ncbi:GNAT family N-acetyltransferase [Phytomonospora endophytica]|uniref:Ribosomal protein S18 acetylase RimI-like enzyme n=1 Tax=Phytomonospora endophytica TaxID=714109 RepID=A0A841FSU4_9ACTN|nr:GNAT family N-acetyltransferase [Phytomonospora endophytica]MBB6035050.1 ribosomal protein S18 acetylase RimI-like enzyme [Phytomonospora endophytica]GIG68304.1 putative acetyltransferase, GNAT [Phytomonospora endophytica]
MITPDGYTARPATLADLPAIHALVAACEQALHGVAETDAEVVAADFARPGLDPDRDTVVVFDAAGALAARAWVNRRSEVDVHPLHRGRGLGGALLAWTEGRARESGTAKLAQTVADADTAAVALVRGAGFEPLVTAWLLEIALPCEPPARREDVVVRMFRAGDEHAVHVLVEDAFDDWQERRKGFDEWARLTVGRSTFAPGVSPLAFAGEELIGAVLSLDDPASPDGYIERVAVRRDHRGRGVASLLLRHAFEGFHRRGRGACTLWTHSDTGALALYERVGMSVRRSSTVHRKDLRDTLPKG